MTIPKGRLIPNRFAPSLVALFLACSACVTPAHAGWLFGGDDDAPQKTQDTSQTAPNPAPATDIEGNVRQARMLRLAGRYKEAIHHLAQLMLVASDDGRVVAEYGKTLAQMGRAQDAVSFLTRASQLRADDWTVFSALGVAFDELGEQDKAKDAYARALALKPDEPSVLNNYALSRLLAHDPQGAHALAARLRAAGGESDPKIARNLAMIADMAPLPKGDGVPAQTQTNKQANKKADAAPINAVPVSAPLVQVQAPTPLPKIQAAKTQTPAPQPADVAMQKVPADRRDGPAKSRLATHPPRRLANADMPEEKTAAKEQKKPVPDPEQIRDSVPALRMSANAY